MSRDFIGNKTIANEEELYQSNYFKLEDKFIIDDEKIKEKYNGDYKKALIDVAKSERKFVIENNILKNRIEKENKKYKEVLDKIKEYAKANKIIEIIALLEVEEIE